MNVAELNNRLKWSLSLKIDHSLYIIDSFLAQNPNSLIAFSGGIDSTVLLYLVRLISKNRAAIFANTTNEYIEILRFVRETENVKIVLPKTTFNNTVKQYGFPLISKKVSRMITDLRNPTDNNIASRRLYLTGIKSDGSKTKSFKLPEKYKYLIDAPFDITYKCCDVLKKKPMQGLSENGVFVGTTVNDSATRRGSYLKTGCINQNKKMCMPLAIWNKDDIWDFIKDRKIQYCPIYDKGEKSTGCAYCGFGIMFDRTRFERLQQREPKRFEQMMELKNNGVRYADAIDYVLQKNQLF